MNQNNRRKLLVGTAIAVISGVVAFAIVRSVDGQDARNPEAGLSDADRMATHTAGSTNSTATLFANNRAIVAANPPIDGMPRTYGSGEPLGVEYATVEDLASYRSVDTIVRGVVASQRIALGDGNASHLVVISTLTTTSPLKGELAATVEVATPVSVTAEGGYRLGISDAYAVPGQGDEVVMFLQTLAGSSAPVVLPWATYVVRSDQSVGIPEGGHDQLNVDGIPASEFLAAVSAGIQQASQE